MNTVENILSQLKAKDKYSYYKQIEVLLNEPNLVKLRIYIRDSFKEVDAILKDLNLV